MACESFAARANKRVTLQPPTRTGDNYGGASVVWTTGNTDVWAIMEPQSGREVVGQGQDQSRVDMRFTIRYRSALADTNTTGKYRIKFGTRYFSVLYVKNLDEDMKREGTAYQVLSCVENAPETA